MALLNFENSKNVKSTKRSVAVTFTEEEKRTLRILLQLDIHDKKTYYENDKNLKEYVKNHNKIIKKIENLP